MACCAPPTRVSPIAAPAVAGSLIAFVIVYFAVFGAGIWYILRLMAQAAAGAARPGSTRAPIRTRRHHARARGRQHGATGAGCSEEAR